jgi:hypothetical protein
MFGFFDRKERKRRKALEAFREEMRKVPAADKAMRSAGQLHIVKRVGVLRASGNEKAVAQEVNDFLEEDVDRWLAGRDAYDLHYVVETLRGCGLVKAAYSLLGKATHEWSKQFPVDPVWIHLDRGLVGHQLGDDVQAQIHCFNEALTCRPPEGSKCSRRDEARLQAAFCGFVAAVANGLEAEGKRFLGILEDLAPERTWNSSETLEEFGKTFVGFLSSDKIPAPAVAKAPSTSAGEKHVLHNCVLNQPAQAGHPGTAQDRLNQSVITAQVRAEKTAEGTVRFVCKFYHDHDPLDVIELNSAIFWYERFEDGTVTRDQVINWLVEFGRIAGIKGLNGRRLTEGGDIVFFGALCTVSMLAFLAFLDSVETRFDEVAKNFRIQLEEQGKHVRRSEMMPKANLLRDLMARGELDPKFSRLLCKSVGMVAD